MSEFALKIIQTTGWQTDLNHPCITKVKEVITGEKSTMIVMEYVRRDEKSDREVYYYTNILTEKIAKFHSGRKTGNLGNNRLWICELAKIAITQNPESEQDKNQAIRSTNEKWEGPKEYGKLKAIKPSIHRNLKTGQKIEKQKMLQSSKYI